jgi:nucleoside-diphosphate-sugar epimerase
VQRIVLPSVPATPVDAHVPMTAARRTLEERVALAVPGSVILRFPPFMEVWLALVGSSLPLRAEQHATVGRPSPFLRRFRAATGSTVEKRGLMLVPGPTTHRQAFIAVADAAAACVVALGRDDLAGQTIDVAGPEVLTWVDVARIFSDVLGRPVRAVSTPSAVFAVLAAALRPIAPVPSQTMALNRYLGASETPWTPGGGGLVDPATMTTVEHLLRSKAALPAEPPTVP